MAKVNAQKALDKRKREEAAKGPVDPNVVKGEVPQAVVEELVSAKERAADLAGAYTDAVKAMAEKYGVKKGALSKFVNAIAADKVEDARAETAQLADMLG
jgi:hypothetical protein